MVYPHLRVGVAFPTLRSGIRHRARSGLLTPFSSCCKLLCIAKHLQDEGFAVRDKGDCPDFCLGKNGTVPFHGTIVSLSTKFRTGPDKVCPHARPRCEPGA